MTGSIKRVSATALSFALAIITGTQTARSQTFESGYYRLTNKWLGESKALDVVNDDSKDKLRMAAANDTSGQSWKLTPVGDGYYRLTTEWLGADKSLNVVNDGDNNNVNLAGAGNVSGQHWKLTSVGGGFYRLTTKWLGEERSLDMVNDSQRSMLQMAESAEVTGQFWKLSRTTENTDVFGPIKTGIHPLKSFKKFIYAGFTVNVNPDLVGKDVTNKALNLLSADLTKITKLLKPEQVKRLRKVPIWIQYKLDKSGMWYHQEKEWLVDNGYPTEIEKSVEICDINNYIEEHDEQPLVVLHELSHAYQDLYLSAIQNKIKAAYNNALKSGKYDKVERSGSIQRAYALTNEIEYFAELSEAYFGKNEYYPFNKDQLEDFDPTGFKLMQEAWGEH